MPAPANLKRSYRFGLFEADLANGELLRQGVRVRLQDLPFRLLTILLERPGEVVSREELRQKLWPADTYVEFDGSLNAALKRLRAALADSADNPIFIETVPKRGYRFIAPVECEPGFEAEETTKPTRLETAVLQSSDRVSRRGLWLWPVLVAVSVALIFAGLRYKARSGSNAPAARKVIAVLPFANEGAGPDYDYLRYAIPNDLVTDLTYERSVTVRPFASTSRYAAQSINTEAAGKELNVTHVVTGGFLLEKQNLRVSLELVDVSQNQSIWREELTVSPRELVALHDQLADRTAKGLLPAMNIANSPASVPAPKNEQALELFLHSLSIPLDPEPNLLAIKKLEESVSLDGGYAPAWAELARRYSLDYQYGNGGEAAAEKSLEAYKRQSELDPNWPAISTTVRVERGDLNGAYDQAADFLRRHPDVALGHHSMSYVLRYAGLLDEANQQCNAALALDPGFGGFRSCAVPYILQGDYARAQNSIQLDGQSGFAATLRMVIALRSGNRAGALAESESALQGGFRFVGVARIYLKHAPESELRKAAAELETDPRSAHDPETLYFNAAVLSFCGQSDAALRQLRIAIKGHYCSYPALDKDPLFDPIRQRPEFAELRHAATQCQESFTSHRSQVDVAQK